MTSAVDGVRAALARLLPASAAVAVVSIDDDEAVHADEAAFVADAVVARRREFAAGRRAARDALRALGAALDQPLLPDADRAPRWPAGTTGSITHTSHLAAAAVAALTTTSAVGLDVEDAVALPDELWSLVLTAGERATLARTATTTSLPASLAARLHFCAKESLYKCVFPLVRRPFDFTDVDVDFEAPGAFVARVRTADLAPASALRGRWGHAGVHFVATTIWPSA